MGIILTIVSASCTILPTIPLPSIANKHMPAAPTFCKCTCFKNSTIIPLGPETELVSSSQLRRAILFKADLASLPPEPRSKSKSCSVCTKAFCLAQGIDFCEDAKEGDVTTMCFQRDSNKDKVIVWGFIVGTVGLLGWAAFKRVVAWREARRMASYAPMESGFR